MTTSSEDLVKDIQAGAAWAAKHVVPLAKALVKMRNASNNRMGVKLTAEETMAVIEALRVLRTRPK
jgi:hypothetical protein